MAVACCRHNPIPSLCRQEERLLRLRIFDAALRMTRFGVVTSNHRAFSVLLSDQREPKDPYSVTAQPILRRFYRRISFNTVGRGLVPRRRFDSMSTPQILRRSNHCATAGHKAPPYILRRYSGHPGRGPVSPTVRFATSKALSPGRRFMGAQRALGGFS